MSTDTIIRLAEEDAASAIEIARSSTEPIAWITGNSYMPPLRDFGQAEQVWAIDDEGESWQVYVDTFEHALDEADVLLDAPEYDNALYVVDTKRWLYVEDAEGDSLDDEWVARVTA